MASPNSEALSVPNSLVRWDFVRGVMDWRLWAFMGLQDIRQRYRRSALGPLWLTLGLGVTIIGIGLIYSQILKTASGNYIPYIAISLLVWNMTSSILTESTVLFQGAGHVITSVRVPYTSFVLRVIVRNLIVAAHSLIVVVIAFVWFKYPVGFEGLAAIPGLLLLCANLYWMALLIGLVSARFRDMAQIFNYSIAIALFVTPVIWMPTSLRPGSPYMKFNPFAQLIQIVRAPIFDHHVPLYGFAYCSVMFLVGMAVTVFAFFRSRRYIVYWI